MNAQDKIVNAGLKTARRVTGRDIVYHRGDTALEFTAIRGRHLEQAVDGTTVIAETEHTDWVFPLAELASLTPTEPSEGDWVEWDGRRLDVTEKPGTGYWQHVDPAATWARVTTTDTGPASDEES